MLHKQEVDVHPIVAQIIDRDCHVSMSNRAVIRHVVSRLRCGYRTFRELAKADRRSFIEQCIFQHSRNWELYAAVMSGSRPKGEQGIDATCVPESLTGQEICRLMRKHKKTIKGLSFALGITCKRIREVRLRGLNDPLAVRDWYEGITGEDPGPLPASYRINHQREEASCGYCGCPLYVGDTAFDYVNEAFCSRTCCRKSRGWS